MHSGGGGGGASSTSILGIPQGHYQRCYSNFAHGIAETVDPSLEFVANVPLQ